jgi:hypothetical protein
MTPNMDYWDVEREKLNEGSTVNIGEDKRKKRSKMGE